MLTHPGCPLNIEICGPPASGVLDLQALLLQAGYRHQSTWDPYAPAVPGTDALIVGVVKHPATWLIEFSEWIDKSISMPRIMQPWLDLAARHATLEEFVAAAIDQKPPGAIGRTFDAYGQQTVMRAEDMPWCALELCHTLGTPLPEGVVDLIPRHHRPMLPDLPKHLLAGVVQAEIEYCERYDYFG